MTQCIACGLLQHKIEQLENMVCTLEQEARQQHARNVRLQEELNNKTPQLAYSKIKESFSR